MDISQLSQAPPDLAPFEDTYRFAAFTIVRFALFSAHALLFGMATVSAVVLRPAFSALDDTWNRARERVGGRLEGLVQASLVASALASLAAIVLQAILVAEAQGGDFSLDSFTGTFGTQFGRWQFLRFPALGALAVLLVGRVASDLFEAKSSERPASKPLWRGAWLVLSGFLLATSSLSGHAAVADPLALSVANDAVHLAAGGVWFAGVAILAIVLPDAWRGRQPTDRLKILAPVVVRFSNLAAVTIAVLALTGTLNSFLHVGAVDDLIDTGYGRTLFLKVVLFGAVLAFGAINHFVIRERLSKAAGATGDIEPARVFRRTIAAELVLALLLMGITGVLVGLGRTRDAPVQETPSGVTSGTRAPSRR